MTVRSLTALYARSSVATQHTNEAHDKGLTGKGIKIAMYVVPELGFPLRLLTYFLDVASIRALVRIQFHTKTLSGIDSHADYMHPNLGGGFGPGFKIEKGYDFIGMCRADSIYTRWQTQRYAGDDYLGDPDPRDTCDGHGTHVAGIIGASGANEFNMTGVAPEATLYAYRVYSCYGYTDSVILYEAMARAYDDGADVISLSIGEIGPWSSTEFSVIASRLAERGKVLTISVGNDGRSGPMMVNSPATGKEVIAVGSVQKYVQHGGEFIAG